MPKKEDFDVFKNRTKNMTRDQLFNEFENIGATYADKPHYKQYIRQLYKKKKRKYDSILLTPTAIYSNVLLKTLKYIKAAAHITGGGIHGNLRLG